MSRSVSAEINFIGQRKLNGVVNSANPHMVAPRLAEKDGMFKVHLDRPLTNAGKALFESDYSVYVTCHFKSEPQSRARINVGTVSEPKPFETRLLTKDELLDIGRLRIEVVEPISHRILGHGELDAEFEIEKATKGMLAPKLADLGERLYEVFIPEDGWPVVKVNNRFYHSAAEVRTDENFKLYALPSVIRQIIVDAARRRQTTNSMKFSDAWLEWAERFATLPSDEEFDIEGWADNVIHEFCIVLNALNPFLARREQ